MTTGSRHHGNGSKAIHPRDDREALSALFDGALSGDAARFALKRLDHDAGWRETCGRWQLIGDVLRGEAIAVAPADFASGVMRASTAGGEAVAAGTPAAIPGRSAPAPAAPRRRWIGAASLAASVAVAAVLVVRPFSRPAPPPGSQAADATTAPSAAPVDVARTAAATSGGARGQPAAPPARLAGPDAPHGTRRTPSLPAMPGKPARASGPTGPASRESATPVAAGSGLPTDTASMAAAAALPPQPFQAPADAIIVRPWPRAVLPDATAGRALTVDFGEGGERRPSFHPFEPRLPNETPPAIPPADGTPR